MTARFLLALGLVTSACTTEGLSEQSDGIAGDDATEKSTMDGYTGADYDVAALPPRLRTGDRVRNGRVSALVPSPGEGVFAEALGIEAAETLSIDVDDDGTAHVSVDDKDDGGTDSDTTEATAPGPCEDAHYNVFDFTWTETLDFTFKASTTPDPLTVAFAEDAVVNGGLNIVNAHNSCGRADHVGAKIHYSGRDSRGVNIATDGVCGKRDGHSSVAFGVLTSHDGDLLGISCVWRRRVWQPGIQQYFHYGIESDVRLQNTTNLYWQDQDCYPLSLLHTVDLESVMTHERGHSFGLAHVPHSPKLTMYPRIRWCDRGNRTLGLGDVLGLETLY